MNPTKNAISVRHPVGTNQIQLRDHQPRRGGVGAGVGAAGGGVGTGGGGGVADSITVSCDTGAASCRANKPEARANAEKLAPHYIYVSSTWTQLEGGRIPIGLVFLCALELTLSGRSKDVNFRFLIIGGALCLSASLALAEGAYQRTKDGKIKVWNPSPKPSDVATWSGSRDKEKFGTGEGTLTWYRLERKYGLGTSLAVQKEIPVVRYTGTMVRGKLEGTVIAVEADGQPRHATFAGGARTTEWVDGDASSGSEGAPLPTTAQAPGAAALPSSSPATPAIPKAQKVEQPAPLHPMAQIPTTESSPAPKTAKAEKTPSPVKAAVANQPNRVAAASTPNKKPAEQTVVETAKSTASRDTSVELAPKPPSVVQRTPRPALPQPIADAPSAVPDFPVSPGQGPGTSMALNQPAPVATARPTTGRNSNLGSLTLPPSSLKLDVLSDTLNRQPMRRSTLPSTRPRLTSTEATALADNEARSQGFPLGDYLRPRADYSMSDDVWSVVYNQRGNGAMEKAKHFTIMVDDRTRKALLTTDR